MSEQQRRRMHAHVFRKSEQRGTPREITHSSTMAEMARKRVKFFSSTIGLVRREFVPARRQPSETATNGRRVVALGGKHLYRWPPVTER